MSIKYITVCVFCIIGILGILLHHWLEMCIYCTYLTSSEQVAHLTFTNFESILNRVSENDSSSTVICSVESHFGDKATERLALALYANTRVTILRLGNNISDAGAKDLAQMLEHNTTLEVLDLSGNVSISAPGIKSLAKVLETNTTLVSLNLSGTNIKQQACEALGRMLKVNTTLRILVITGSGFHNKFGDNGVKGLEAGLKHNRSLTKLSIANNGITSVGANILAGILEKNFTMTEFNISSNSFGPDGLLAFMKMLMVNVTLTKVNISSDNQFDPNLVASMSQMIASNEKLTNLTMFVNLTQYWGLNPGWTTQLELALESNNSLMEFNTNIVSSNFSEILFDNNFRRLFITLMLLFSAYGSIVPLLVIKRIVKDVLLKIKL